MSFICFSADNEFSVLDEAYNELGLSVQVNQLINPIDSLLSFKDQCVDAKRNDLAYNCYTNISTLIIYDPEVVDKIAFLDQIMARKNTGPQSHQTSNNCSLISNER